MGATHEHEPEQRPRSEVWAGTMRGVDTDAGVVLAHRDAPPPPVEARLIGREAREEANVEVELEQLFTVFSLPHISQVYAFFLGTMPEPIFSPGEESLEVRLFHEDEIPWDDLAFETVRRSLRLFFADRRSGNFGFRVEDIFPPSFRA